MRAVAHIVAHYRNHYYIIITSTCDSFNEYQLSVIYFACDLRIVVTLCECAEVCVCGCVTTFLDTVTAFVSYCAVSRVVIAAMTDGDTGCDVHEL